ncbi:hypothetical protein IFO69_14000 [Echinicola sp. CAU 1574]|uniref:Uncharacterized protein n=1 Tax=Echinicola arenosa TaxID=2774144 RepID=A0ABR9AM47_9BACT|nr:hypothetical protein [Echinicola arenosa]MBD8489867.1 hypothetical protein [Echinicola arenosa]
MKISRKDERARWALVFLIGLLVSFIISEMDEKPQKSSNISQSDSTLKAKDFKFPSDKIILKLLPDQPNKPKELLHY